MSELLGIAQFFFHPGQVEEFKRLSARCMDIVRTQDTGTVGYDVYLNEQETEAVVVERYRDSSALIEHHGNVGPELMQAVTQTAEVTGETLGRPNEQLRAMLAQSEVRLFAPFLSLSDTTPGR